MVPVALDLLLGLGRVARERHGEQALLGDRLGRDLADAVRAVADPLDGGLDLGERLLLVRDEAEGEVAVKGVGARVGHVLPVRGEVPGVVLHGALQRLLGVALDALGQVLPQVDKQLVVPLEFLLNPPLLDHLGSLRPLGIESEDVRQGCGLDMVRLGGLLQGGVDDGRGLGDHLGGLGGRFGLCGHGLRDRPHLIQAEGDRLGGGLAGEDAVAQGCFL